jgi:hypothetical protein
LKRALIYAELVEGLATHDTNEFVKEQSAGGYRRHSASVRAAVDQYATRVLLVLRNVLGRLRGVATCVSLIHARMMAGLAGLAPSGTPAGQQRLGYDPCTHGQPEASGYPPLGTIDLAPISDRQRPFDISGHKDSLSLLSARQWMFPFELSP